MRIVKPSYFDSFRCLAGQCPDSCCKEWDVLVDENSAVFYRNLPGELGERLRQVLKNEDNETVMILENGRCPMWRQDGLCRIQAELGHDALCKTCGDFPRLTHDYGNFTELGLELSCPEAARLILSSPALPAIITDAAGGEAPDYDTDAMDILLRTRAVAFSLLSDPAYTPQEALALLLYYGYQTQMELDYLDAPEFIPEQILAGAKKAAQQGCITDMLAFWESLEILTDRWKQRLSAPCEPHRWTEEYRNLARYFVERYWLQAVSDYDLVCRVKLVVISCLVIRYLGGDLLETAQLYSKEIENDADNVEALLDAACSHPAFTDVKLLDLLLK